MVKKDCFGFEDRGNMRAKDCCAALQKLYCVEGKCRFYKSKTQRESEELENKARKEQRHG